MIIQNVKARQVIDSRGNPTIEAEILLEDGSFGRAIAPSGASTGSLEAYELRDNGKNFHGKSVENAVKNVNEKIAELLVGMDATNQSEIDRIMIEGDGKENKSSLGANAILAVSLANAHAAADCYDLPLYRYIGGIAANLMPVPMMNIINGGKHADNLLDIQEFMIMPVGAESISHAIRIGSEIFHSLKILLKNDRHNVNVGDEGGFAPNFKSSDEALSYLSKAIEKAGYEIGKDVSFALDAASSEFYKNEKYHIEGKILNAEQLCNYYKNLVEKYNIISIEDPFAEDDYEGWGLMTAELGKKIQIVGDDLFVTNPKIINKLSAKNLANAVLIKPNQIGTLTETLEAIAIAKSNNYNTIISHRSGESEDVTIAHIAVATNSGQIKTGSLCRTDRTAKYNELIRIEDSGNFAYKKMRLL